MTFHEKRRLDDALKARAHTEAIENIPIPKDFDSRIDALLDTLPTQEQQQSAQAPSGLSGSTGVSGPQPIHSKRASFQHAPHRLRSFLRVAVVAVAAVFIVGAGAVTVAPTVFSLTQGAIRYFQGRQNSDFASQQDEMEHYNAAVEISQTNDRGQTMTIHNIAMDNSYMNIFYTLTSKTPIEKPGTDDDPPHWRAKWAAPFFHAEVNNNGKQLDNSGLIETEAYFVDDYTIEGAYRLVLKETLPDTFEMLLYTEKGELSSEIEKDFQFPLTIDKSAITVDSLFVEPKQDVHLDYTMRYANGNTNRRKVDFRIERVSISPICSTLTLSEVTDDWGPFSQFVLRDDKGKYLYCTSESGVGSGILRNRVNNVFEFYGADMQTKSLTLIPISGRTLQHEVTGSIDALPLTDDTSNGFVLEQLDVGEKQTTAVFSFKGAMPSYNPGLVLLDEEGNELHKDNDIYVENTMDRSTGKLKVTLYYPRVTPETIAQIQNVSFLQPDDGIQLLEDQAVVIPLQ